MIPLPTCRTLGGRAHFSSGKLARALLLVPLLLATALIWLPVERAAALTDISGTWNITLLHPDAGGPIACGAVIAQPGSTLSASMTCTGLGSGTLTGSINTSSGAFTLSGPIADFTMNMSGTAAGDGNSMSGTFTLPPIPSNGTFSGFRKSAPPPLGGVAELPQLEGASLQSADKSSGLQVALIVAGATSLVLVLGGAAWYARRRRSL